MAIMKKGASKHDISTIQQMSRDGKTVNEIHKALRIYKATIKNFVIKKEK